MYAVNKISACSSAEDLWKILYMDFNVIIYLHIGLFQNKTYLCLAFLTRLCHVICKHLSLTLKMYSLLIADLACLSMSVLII